MTTRYRVENITKVYGNAVTANDAISLDVRAGEVFGLLGPNGAGKTTLVQQMVTLLTPDAGRIWYRDRPVAPGDRWLKRHVAYLSQRPLALLDLTVREALSFTGRLRGLPAAQAAAETDAWIDQLDLTGCADRVVATLSGGQHRLVALGSALIGDAETMVLDEPTNELDPEMRRRVWAILKERSRERGTTVILVTHNALEAEQVIERLAILADGKVITCGTPGEIKAQIDDCVRIELTFRADPNGTTERLGALGQITRPTPRKAVLIAPRNRAQALINQVLETVSMDELDDFRILTPTLEDVYLHVAGRDGPEPLAQDHPG
jgi:ABC-2 type transport system ATP-binding protein